MTQKEFDESVDQVYAACRGQSAPYCVEQQVFYKKVSEMGMEAVPFILRMIQNRLQKGSGDVWFISLLDEIVETNQKGSSPKLPKEDFGRIKKINEQWVQWGKEKGYIK